MQIKVDTLQNNRSICDTVIINYNEEVELSNRNIENYEEIKPIIKNIIREEIFTGKYGEVHSFRYSKENNSKNIILIGMGKTEELNNEKTRKIVAKAIKEAKKLKSKYIELRYIGWNRSSFPRDWAMAVSEGAILAEYKFDKYKSEKKESTIKELNIICDENLEDIKKGVSEGIILSQATILARNLVNEPANILGPGELAEEVEILGNNNNFEIKIYNEDEILDFKMHSFLEVSRGSDKKPKLIVMRYFGNNENKEEIIGLVGKGLTYDSGGLSLKPADSMVDMKSDMAGAAAVIGTISAIAQLKLNVNVVGIIAACENMISGRSYRPGDIINSMGGKTVEILNTDAEGRLTLIDAVNYAIEKEGATKIIDIATLTGAALVALGTTTTAVVSNNDDLYNKLETASNLSGEKVWRLPNFDEYKELIKSSVADLKNIGGRNAGTITAALFIEEFVQGKPWIHLDIAGTSWSDKDKDYISKGGTGVGVRMLYHLLKIL